jgi:hypothetical protein
MSKRLEMLEKLIGAGSRDPFHHYARALELRSLSKKREALEALAGVIAEFADYVPSYLMAAQLAQELGDAAGARAAAEAGVAAAKRSGNDHALSELESLLAGL